MKWVKIATERIQAIKVIFIGVPRWIDAFWGYDVFIAHRRADAAEYARALHETLTTEKISSFIDRVVYGPGDSLLIATRRHVTKSTLFLLIGSPELLISRKPVDWVEREVETYLTSQKTDPRLLLIDFGDTVTKALACAAIEDASSNPVLRQVEPFLRISEELPALAKPPSEDVLDAIRGNLHGRRRDRTRLRFFEGLACALAILFTAAAALGGYAFYQRSQVQKELNRANKALAVAIRNDLSFLPNLHFTTRNSQALWSLAVADQAVKDSFVSALAEDPKELIRLSPGFVQISRALGLMWPPQAEAEILFEAALKGFTGASLANFCLPELKTLAGKLGAEKRAQVLGQLLVQLGQPNQVQVHRGLPQAIEALAPKLTEAQARQALEPVLHQLRQTTDPIAFQGLVQAFLALAANSSRADVQQVFDLLLHRSGDTRIPYQVTAFALALQVLAPELAEPQAREALDLVLRQIGEAAEPSALQALALALPAIPPVTSGADAQEAFYRLLRRLSQQRISVESRPLAQAIRSTAPKLTEIQAQGAIDTIRQQIGDTTDTVVLGALAQTLQVLVAKQPELKALQNLDSVMERFNEGANPKVLRMAGHELRALAPQLTQIQVRQAFEPVLRHFTETEDQSVVQALAQALGALMPKLTDEQGQRMLNPILQRMGNTFDPEALRALAEVLQALVPKLTDLQAQQVLDPIGLKVARTTYPDARGAVAKVVQALTPKLTDAQVQQAFHLSSSSLAWAFSVDEAEEWARSLVALSFRDQNDKQMIAAIAFPAAAGPATEILVKGIRDRTPAAPITRAGPNSVLEWVATKYPWILEPPTCPQPLMRSSVPDFKCPTPQ